MKSFDGFECKEQKDFESFMMRYKPEFRDFEKVGESTYSNTLTSIAYDSYLAGQQSKQAEVDELQKRIDDALVKISNHHQSCVARKKLKRMSASISEISEIEVHELNMRALKNILKGEQS